MANEALQKVVKRKVGGVRIRVLNAVIIVLVCVVTLMFLSAVRQTNDTYTRFEDATESFVACDDAANDLRAASNYLTRTVRQFVMTGVPRYLENYLRESFEAQRRDKAVQVFEEHFDGQEALEYLQQSRADSQALMQTEYHAVRLAADAYGVDLLRIANADEIAAFALSPEEAALDANEKIELAEDLLFDRSYDNAVVEIENDVELCKEILVKELEAEKAASAEVLGGLLVAQRALALMLLALVVFLILANIALILWPIREHVVRIGENKPLDMVGANELRIMAEEYNLMYEENLKHSDALRKKAEHDHMTGLFNREVFDRLLHAYRDEPVALLIIDADYFKNINDTYGHEGGDKILQKVARLLQETFRSSDVPCRIGGDEFAVIMTEMTEDMAPIVAAKIKAVVDGLSDTSDGLPAMTLSVGVAFSKDEAESATLFARADEALYRVKEAGRNGYQFY